MAEAVVDIHSGDRATSEGVPSLSLEGGSGKRVGDLGRCLKNEGLTLQPQKSMSCVCVCLCVCARMHVPVKGQGLSGICSG